MTIPTSTTERALFQDPTALRIRVDLLGIAPPIWRELVVPIRFTLAKLHLVIQSAFGWHDAHLHQFNVGGLHFGDAKLMRRERIDDSEPRTFEAADVMLRDFSFTRDGGPTFEYVYDFGDNWRHTVALVEELYITPAPKVASCTGGARACPPEDVGGPHGYERFLRILLTPEDDERQEQAELKVWSGGKFHPSTFDLARTDRIVRGALRGRRE